MAEELGLGTLITPAVALLGATVLAIPLFRRLGLGSVLGYFAAGVIIGPSGFALIHDPQAILHVAELGVVLFLFIIGLELRPVRLWAMRQQIFGLGLLQVFACIALLMLAGIGFGYSPAVSFVAASGFVLSSTAVIMSVLQEQGELGTAEGQRSVSILLFEDLMIVPLLALVAFLAPSPAEAGNFWITLATGLIALVILLAAGRWLMDPMFALLARAGSREAMSAGALLVVLGAALLMENAGLSMAMGAFIAGVMLSGSSYRHQIEADIEPFRGILMGLFFLSVGMSLNLTTVAGEWLLVVTLVAVFMAVKAFGVYVIARLAGANSRTAIRRMVLFAQGGEFAFVLYSGARGTGLFDPADEALFSAVVILSMALTPLALLAVNRLLPPEGGASMDGVDEAADLHGRALLIGFGRFGQIASQGLLARGVDVSIIDTDIEMIRAAETLGFKVYYGDGTRLDILHASGADEAELILICVDNADTANKIVELAQAEFPHAKLLVRAIDRRHSIHLRSENVEYEIRELLESAMMMARQALAEIGADEADIDEIIADLRARDRQRLALQLSEGLAGGRDLLHKNISDSFRQH